MSGARVIGLAGLAGAGKTTTAHAMERINGRVRRVAIGDPLRAMLAGFYQSIGLDPMKIAAKVDGALKRCPCVHLSGRTPTHAMQTLGTEWGRELIGTHLWLDAWASRATAAIAAGHLPVQDSVRFDNEVELIRALGGIVIRLEGRGGLAGAAAAHPSERGVDADAVVRVDAEPEEVARRVLAAAGWFPIAA